MAELEDALKRPDVNEIVTAFSGDEISNYTKEINTNISQAIQHIISPAVGLSKTEALTNIDSGYTNFNIFLKNRICAIRILHEFNIQRPNNPYKDWHAGIITPDPKTYGSILSYNIDDDGTDIYEVINYLKGLGFSTDYKPAKNYSKGQHVYLFR
jgi:hypothetical protein